MAWCLVKHKDNFTFYSYRIPVQFLEICQSLMASQLNVTMRTAAVDTVALRIYPWCLVVTIMPADRSAVQYNGYRITV